MGWIADLLKEIPSAARYKSELEAMEKENAVLKSQVSDLRQEIQRRDDIIQKEKSHGEALDEVKEKILALVAVQDGIADHDVAQSLNLNGQLATFHLQELEANHLARRTLQAGARFTPWHITQEGRRYLVTHGLIS